MESILHSFAYGLDYLREQVADVSDADVVAQPGGIVNHLAWVIGHLAFSCQELAAVFGVPPWLPPDWARRFGSGSMPVADASAYETKAALLARLADAGSRITQAIERLDSARLAEPFPDMAYLDVFPTIRHALTQVLVAHTAYHVGQVSAWRKARGLPAMGRGFE